MPALFRRTSVLPIWLVFLLLVTPLSLGGIAMAVSWWRLEPNERVAGGTLTRFVAADHARYDYAFAVAGRRYTGRGNYGRGDDGEKAVGRAVRVHYDARDPAISTLDDFARTGRGYVIAALIFWFFGLAMCSAITWLNRRMPAPPSA